MPLTSSVADALGVVTITFVAILVVFGSLCIIYSSYFLSRMRHCGSIQLGYFSGPWVIRVAFIIFAIWWGIGEVVRLNLLRQEGRVLNALNLQWQKNVCKGYIVSNLGFAEPCLFLTLTFLLRASLQNTDFDTLSQKWNRNTAGYILLYCLPVFILQLVTILVAPEFNRNGKFMGTLPPYFTSSAASSETDHRDNVAFCTYPLFSTILLGLFATSLTVYLFWLGRRILNLVINKGLQKRVYTLVISVSGLFPLRVLFLGLSVLSEPEHVLFETFAFAGFFSLSCCAGVGIYTLVYCPVADCLALRSFEDIEPRMGSVEEHSETLSLIANQDHVAENDRNSPQRSCLALTKHGSISLPMMERDETSRPFVVQSFFSGDEPSRPFVELNRFARDKTSMPLVKPSCFLRGEPLRSFVELSCFSPSQHSTPPGSPQLLSWPMLRPTEDHS